MYTVEVKATLFIMIKEHKTTVYRSCIPTRLLESTLKRGSILGIAGALLLVIGGTIIPLEQLTLWGGPFFLLGLFFIALGLVPYKKLAHLQLKPHEIHTHNGQLTFLKQGKPLFHLDCRSIAKIAYLEKEHLYGVGIWLKRPLEKNSLFFQKKKRVSGSGLMQECDLFLPFFTQKTAEELALYHNPA